MRGNGSASSCECIRLALINKSSNIDLSAALTAYGESCENADWDLIRSYLFYEKYPLCVGFAIGLIVRMREDGEGFWERVVEIAEGLPWDTDEEARTQAVSNIGDGPKSLKDMFRRPLRITFLDSDNILKDVAAKSAWMLISPETWVRRRIKGDGKLLENAPEEVVQWLLST